MYGLLHPLVTTGPLSITMCPVQNDHHTLVLYLLIFHNLGSSYSSILMFITSWRAPVYQPQRTTWSFPNSSRMVRPWLQQPLPNMTRPISSTSMEPKQASKTQSLPDRLCGLFTWVSCLSSVPPSTPSQHPHKALSTHSFSCKLTF